MPDLSDAALWVNGVLLLVTLIIAIVMLRTASIYTFHLGNFPIQNRMKWIILRSLLVLIAVGLAASVFNLFFG
jgi:hypothetical protein